jgi:hypothetical protein
MCFGSNNFDNFAIFVSIVQGYHLTVGFGSGGPIAVTAQQVLAAPAPSAIALNLQVRNCSISQYIFNADAFQLATFNGIPHLDHAERHDFQTYG